MAGEHAAHDEDEEQEFSGANLANDLVEQLERAKDPAEISAVLERSNELPTTNLQEREEDLDVIHTAAEDALQRIRAEDDEKAKPFLRDQLEQVADAHNQTPAAGAEKIDKQPTPAKEQNAAREEPKAHQKHEKSYPKEDKPKSEEAKEEPKAAEEPKKPQSAEDLDRESRGESDTYVMDKTQGHVEALVQAEFMRRIAGAEGNYNLQAKLREDMPKAMAEVGKAQLDIATDAINATNLSLGEADMRKGSISTVGPDDPDLEDKARNRRIALDAVPTPFLERKTGGANWLKQATHVFSKDRAKYRSTPKVAESYFRVPGRNNVMVVERHIDKTGELLSQSIITTNNDIRERRSWLRNIDGTRILKGELPPNETMKSIRAVGAADEATLRSGDWRGDLRYKKRKGAINGLDGVYARYGATDEDLAKFKQGSRKRGGFLFWLSGGRT